jgi:ribosomal protein S18 acetylase RimI-like enzyme
MVRVNHKQFEKRILVRPLKIDDFDQLVELERRCFPDMKAWKKEHIESQLRVFPEGQIVVEYHGRIVASSSSLVIDFDEYEEGHSWNEITDEGYIRNHDPEGDTLYGIEIMVDPDFRRMRLSRRLYDARKQLCRELNLKRIIVGGRISGYGKHKHKMSAREYVEKVIDKKLYDPVLTMQIANGFVLKRLIRSYLTSDVESDGWATLLEWINLDYQPTTNKKLLPSRPVRICVIQYQMRPIKSIDEFSQQCEYFVDVASGYHSHFILFPELLTTQLLSFAEAERPALAVRKLSDFTPLYLELFSKLAIQYNVNIIGGSHFTLEEDDLYNISYLFKRNGEIGKQYKLHITPSEKRWWGVQRFWQHIDSDLL